MYQLLLNKGDSSSQNATIIENTITVNRDIPDGFLAITPGKWPLCETTEITALTGVFSVSGSTVSGNGTKFKSELAVGSSLYNSQGKLIGAVGSIASDTSATLIAVMFAVQSTEAAGFTTASPVFDFKYSAVRSMDCVITANSFGTVVDFQWRSLHWKISSISRIGTTVTVVLDSTYGQGYYFNVGDAVTITGVVEAGFNGTFTIVSKVDNNTFTYTSGTSGTTTGTTSNIITAVHFGHLDKWINTHKAVGSKIIFTIFGTPQWATDTPNAVNAAYPNYHGGTSPINLTAGYPGLVAFLVALWGRYGTKLNYFEIWNEPAFNADGSARSFFYTGTADTMAAMMRIVKHAVVANGMSTIKVISPAPWSASDITTFKALMEATGGTSYAINPTTYPTAVVANTNADTNNTAVLNFASISLVNAHIGLSVLERYPSASGRTIPLGTKLVSFTATSITLSNNVTVPSGTPILIGTGADYFDICGTHTYHKQFTGDIFTQLTALKSYLTSIDKAAASIFSTEVGYLEATGNETDQEYIDNITGLLAESVLSGCDLVTFYSWTHGTMGISEKPAVISNISRILLALNGQHFNTALIRPALKTLTVS